MFLLNGGGLGVRVEWVFVFINIVITSEQDSKFGRGCVSGF